MFVPSKEYIRHVLLDEFPKHINSKSPEMSLQRFYGNDIVNERGCRWFSCFTSEDLSLEDELKEGHSKQYDTE